MKEKYNRYYCELTVKGYDALRRIFDCLDREERELHESDLHEVEDILVMFNSIKRDAEWIRRRLEKFKETGAPQLLIDNERRRACEHYIALEDGALGRSEEAEKKLKEGEERLYRAIFGGDDGKGE